MDNDLHIDPSEHEIVLDFVVNPPLAPVQLEERVFEFQRVADEHLASMVDGPVVAGDFSRSSIEVAFSFAGSMADLHRAIAEVVESLEAHLDGLGNIQATTSRTEQRESVLA